MRTGIKHDHMTRPNHVRPLHVAHLSRLQCAQIESRKPTTATQKLSEVTCGTMTRRGKDVPINKRSRLQKCKSRVKSGTMCVPCVISGLSCTGWSQLHLVDRQFPIITNSYGSPMWFASIGISTSCAVWQWLSWHLWWSQMESVGMAVAVGAAAELWLGVLLGGGVAVALWRFHSWHCSSFPGAGFRSRRSRRCLLGSKQTAGSHSAIAWCRSSR